MADDKYLNFPKELWFEATLGTNGYLLLDYDNDYEDIKYIREDIVEAYAQEKNEDLNEQLADQIRETSKAWKQIEQLREQLRLSINSQLPFVCDECGKRHSDEGLSQMCCFTTGD